MPMPRTCKESGCNVIVSELPGTENYDLAVKHGFKPLEITEAVKKADIMTVLLPDELQGDVFTRLHPRQPQPGQHPGLFARIFDPLRPDRAAQGSQRDDGRPQGPRPSGPQRIRQGGRRSLPGRRAGRLGRRHAASTVWPMPRESAAPRGASFRPPSAKRPRPTCSASRSSCAAASANWSRRASRHWSRPAISPKWPISNACTN